jgi:hypothetical protein
MLSMQALENTCAIVAQAGAKLDELRGIEPYLIDLSLRENPVGSNIGQTLRDNNGASLISLHPSACHWAKTL